MRFGYADGLYQKNTHSRLLSCLDGEEWICEEAIEKTRTPSSICFFTMSNARSQDFIIRLLKLPPDVLRYIFMWMGPHRTARLSGTGKQFYELW